MLKQLSVSFFVLYEFRIFLEYCVLYYSILSFAQLQLYFCNLLNAFTLGVLNA